MEDLTDAQDHSMALVKAPRKRMSPTEAAARLTRAFILMGVMTVREASEKSDVNVATSARYIRAFIREGLIERDYTQETFKRTYRWIGVV